MASSLNYGDMLRTHRDLTDSVYNHEVIIGTTTARGIIENARCEHCGQSLSDKEENIHFKVE